MAAAVLVAPATASATPCGFINRTLDTPLPISDGVFLSSTTNSIYVPPPDLGDPSVQDVDINVDITHPSDSDLSISISHGGKTVGLSSGNGGSGQNYTGTIFDDEAIASITVAPSPFTGSFKPESALSGFDGMDPTGVWTISVRDSVGSFSGGGNPPPPPPQTLNGWGIGYSAANCPFPQAPCDEVGGEVDVGPSNFGSITTFEQYRGTGTVTGVDVRVYITHPDDSQLSMSLKHGSTTVGLLAQGTTSGANFTGTLFTNGSPFTIAIGSAPYSASFAPAQSLAAFNGQALGDRWALTVADNAAGPTGTLDRWGARIHLDTCTDPDNDVVWSAMDNCPALANVNQANHDLDGQGDACDPDDDNDTVADTADACPLGPVSFGPLPADTDHDGCLDSEDPDDDNDGLPDTADGCPLQAAAAATDPDRDGCANDIDADDDGDGVADTADHCPLGVVGPGDDADGNGCKGTEDPDGDGVPESRDRCPLGTPGPGNDADGDGCKDAEDLDDDDDGIADAADNCKLAPNAGQVDSDRDGQGDACDVDDDNDGLVDGSDACHLLRARTLSGCPTVNRRLTLKRFHGKLRGTLSVTARTKTAQCIGAQKIVLRRDRKGPDPAIGRSLTTSRSGAFTITAHLRAGRYYAQVRASVVRDVAACAAATSKRLTVAP